MCDDEGSIRSWYDINNRYDSKGKISTMNRVRTKYPESELGKMTKVQQR